MIKVKFDFSDYIKKKNPLSIFYLRFNFDFRFLDRIDGEYIIKNHTVT